MDNDLEAQVRQYVLDLFGEPCPDFEPDCPKCRAYEGLNAIFGEE